MGRKSKVQKALEDASKKITRFFDTQTQQVFRKTELYRLFKAQDKTWGLPSSMLARELFSKLPLTLPEMKAKEFHFYGNDTMLYLWGKPSVYEVAMTLDPQAYLSHYSALFLNDLTDQIPKIIYLNHEQKQKALGDALLETEIPQEQIDDAFSRPQRISKNIVEYDQNSSLCLLNGMGDGKVGIVVRQVPPKLTVRVSDLERTLLDCAVSPYYAGGVFQVRDAFTRAAERLSVNKLIAYLRKMKYRYPFHQVIGFYLEASGAYKDKQLALLDAFPRKRKFYLMHGIEKAKFSERWQLYYPEGL